MVATDIRDLNWTQIRDHLTPARMRIHETLQRVGQSTSMDLAERAGLSLWSVRPRMTELAQMGLVRCVGHIVRRGKRHGVYEAVGLVEAEAAWIKRDRPEQLNLGIQE